MIHIPIGFNIIMAPTVRGSGSPHSSIVNFKFNGGLAILVLNFVFH